jgi:hypothetical protein
MIHGKHAGADADYYPAAITSECCHRYCPFIASAVIAIEVIAIALLPSLRAYP